MVPYGRGNAFDRLENAVPRTFKALSYDLELVNFTDSPRDDRRGREGEPVRDEANSGIVIGQVRSSNLPRTSTTESGMSVEYDSQVYILDHGIYPVYSADDVDAAEATEFTVPDEPSKKRYRTLDYRSQQNGLLEIDVEEIASEPTGSERE